MCNIIICGGPKDHECNEEGRCYETRNGQRFYFRNASEGEEWYNLNYMVVIMGSVACSICGDALIDDAWKL